jgi:8-oxo-dGTP pyrophosphatase MutT (NUDIX family)
MLHMTKDRIKAAIQAYEKDYSKRYGNLFSPDAFAKMRRAAVMIPLLEVDHQWHVLLTQRSESLVEHRGQVAYPGGAQELQDKDLQQTALREMQEEIGVHPDDVVVFGHLGDMPIVTGYLVRPFVGQIPWPYVLKLSNDEVQRAFTMPLNWLSDPKNYKVAFRSYAGREFQVIFFDHYNGHQLWGASAEMTLALLSALSALG